MRLPKIIVGLVAGALLIAGGAISVNAAKSADAATSTFTKSTFDYIVTYPTKEQVAEFEANKEVVSEVFPTYNFELTLKNGSAAWKTNLLASDRMEHYDISFFNPRRVVSGAYDENGIMIDEQVAESLGATVGTELTFGLGANTFKLPVKVIYGAVNYQSLRRGVAMVKFTDQMKNGFTKTFSSYELGFIAAKDKAKCAEMLQNYLPYGELMTYEEYKTEAKKIADPSLTDEEFEQAVTAAYNKYKSDWLDREHPGCVQDKSQYMAGAEDIAQTTVDSARYFAILFAVGAPIVLGGALVGLDFLGRKGDEERKANGATKKQLRSSIFAFDFIAVGIAFAMGLVGTIIFSVSAGAMDIASILIYSLPALAALAIALPFGNFYANVVYGSGKAIEEKAEKPAERP